MALRDDLDLNEAEVRFYLGKVVTNADPQLRGRVKATIPGLIGTTRWAFPAGMPGASHDRGMFFVPRAGSSVIVGFHQGDLDSPFYFTGPWHNNKATGKAAAPMTNVGTSDAPEGTVTADEADRVMRFKMGRWEWVIDTRNDFGEVGEGARGAFDGRGRMVLRDGDGSQNPTLDSSDIGKDVTGTMTTANLPDLGIEFDKPSNTLTLSGTVSVVVKGGLTISIDAPEVSINGRKVLATKKPI